MTRRAGRPYPSPGTFRIGAALSLTGRFARFGGQASAGLRVWHGLHGGAGVEVLDDGSSPAAVGPALDALAERCDLLLGPYGTSTARAAARWARERDRLVWNHGGAGSDLPGLAPRRLVSLITPTDRYGEPFLRHLAATHAAARLRLVSGPGTFGPQVVDGMRRRAATLGVRLSDSPDADALFTAGTFEHDTAFVAGLPRRPAVLGTVAAGVHAFADAVPDPDGVFGVAQWVPGTARRISLGPDEDPFVERYRSATGSAPDYPAVQIAAAAAIAVHCATLAGTTDPDALWDAAVGLRATTLYGDFGLDPTTGAQTEHALTLVRWRAGAPVPVR